MTINGFPPAPNAQEKSRQDFVVDLRKYAQDLGGANYDLYKSAIEPQFVSKTGREPKSVQEVRDLMTDNDDYQFWSALQRNSQEMVWDSVIDTAERALDDVRQMVTRPNQLGSLRLDPDLETPKYHDVYDIHLMPGGYHTDQVEDDVAAGLIYDLGVPVYSLRSMGRENDSTGLTLVNAFETLYPDARPERILDLGCAIGNSTMPWAQHFPDAEVHGIDIGAPCLRYGHVRANSYGQALHLSQQNAEHTDFPDDYFDVVVSALLFHETSYTATHRIFGEVARILKPGGVMIHFDGFNLSNREPIVEYLGFWEVFNNNEYFLLSLQTIDVIGLSQKEGLGNARFEKLPFIKTAVTDDVSGNRGYIAGGGNFGDVNLLVAEKTERCRAQSE